MTQKPGIGILVSVLGATLALPTTGLGHRLSHVLKTDTQQVLQHVVNHQAQVPAAQALADPLLLGPDTGAKPRQTHSIVAVKQGTLMAGWQDWSWAKHTPAVPVPGQGTMAIAVDFDAWSGLALHPVQPIDAWSGSVTLSINGGPSGGQQVNLVAEDTNGNWGTRVLLGSLLPHAVIPAGKWVTVTVPLTRLISAGTPIGGLVLQAATAARQPTMYVGAITMQVASLTDYATGSVPIQLRIDTTANRHAISPYIYGLAGDDGATYMRQIRPTLMRWGGNPNSRFNWQLGNAWNTAHDYYYENVNYGHATGSASDAAVAGATQNGAAEWLTIPTLGWVAKDTTSFSFPGADGKPTDGQGSSCTNRKVTADPARTSIQVGPAFMQQWVRHLQARHLPVAFFSMDNEPDLWGVTHYDVHPTCTGYDEIYKEFTSYGDAIKDVAPHSQVTGPATCCWYYYWNSMLGAADRAAHGAQDFLPWFLARVRAHDQQTRRRTLDVLDVHYYPEGFYNYMTDALTSAWRLQETRSLWDPTFVDHSWIAKPIQLIPRLQGLIAQSYPGTKLGIGEWNFGADTGMNGALAIADVLGIFGEHNLYMAAYWRNPPAGSPGAMAFQMYRNYDGHGAAFGDTSVQAVSSNRDRVSIFASLRHSDGHLLLLLVNKMPATQAKAGINLGRLAPKQIVAYRYDGGHPQGIQNAGIISASPHINLQLPPYSITLLDVTVSGAK